MARGKRVTRQTQLAGREDIRKQLLKVFRSVEDGFRDQIERADCTLDYWDGYNCILNTKQFYNSDFSSEYIPLVHNAIEARKTRFLNQVFPQAGRYLEVTTEDGDIPHAEMALLEMYVDQAELRTMVVPPLLVSGDVEGQYTVCVTWGTQTRHVVSRETHPIRIGGLDHPGMGEEERIKAETVEESRPYVDIVSDADFLILPVTSDGIDDALENGGSVTALCRWTQAKLDQLIERGEIDGDLTAELLVEMKRAEENASRDTAKKLADDAGIKAGGKYAMVYRTWAKLKVQGELRLCLAYFHVGSEGLILGCKINPYWCDKCDYLSEPVKKMPGVAKGMSPVQPCMDMQYLANDFTNMAADSCILTLNPVIMTDPQKNPRVGSMVLDNMAIWETSPNDTKPLEFPAVYQHAFNVIAQCERYVNMTLGVSASMIPQSTGNPGRKRSQAEVALEQQVEVLTTNVEVSGAFETGILTKIVQRFAEYDAQFRDDEITVRSVGELGVKAQMVTVPPLQMGKRWRYRWFGVEAARTAQQIQQQISLVNVLKGMTQDPSIMQAGYRLNLVPFIKVITENAFGPRMAPEIFENVKDKLSLDPELENGMLLEAFDVPVSPQDDDPAHMQSHLQAMQQTQDLRARASFGKHLAAHQQQMQMKQAAQMMQKLQQQMQAGGGQGGPGRGPQPGATPQPPRQGREPAGRIHPDQFKSGVIQMPRRM